MREFALNRRNFTTPRERNYRKKGGEWKKKTLSQKGRVGDIGETVRKKCV